MIVKQRACDEEAVKIKEIHAAECVARENAMRGKQDAEHVEKA